MIKASQMNIEMEADTFNTNEKNLVQIRKAVFSEAGTVCWPRIEMPLSVKERFLEVGLSLLGQEAACGRCC